MTRVSPSKPPAISLKDVRFGWQGRSPFHLSVQDFTLARGETLLLLGESGSGKSTLLSLICGVNTPQFGQVMVNGTDISGLRGGARDRFRAEHIGVIFQMFNLLPYASPLDNILLPLHFAPDRRQRCGNLQDTALDLTDALGLPRDLIVHGQASRLSVGQQQRVAVVRALIGHPQLIVADEPTSSLDAGAQAAFLAVLFEQVRAAGTTLLMVSHDERLADRFDHVLQLEDVAQIERERIA